MTTTRSTMKHAPKRCANLDARRRLPLSAPATLEHHAPQISIVEKVEHPDYDTDTLVNDVSLLRLQTAPTCISSIVMPTLDDGAHSQGGAPLLDARATPSYLP